MFWLESRDGYLGRGRRRRMGFDERVFSSMMPGVTGVEPY